MSWSPLIVTVAPNGARRTKADHPALPITPEELARTATDCADAGAAVLHLHVRDDADCHVLDVEAYRRAIDAIRHAAGHRLVVQVTTESVGRYGPAEQMSLVRDLQPESVSLALREIAPGPTVEPAAAHFLAWLASAPIHPQFILYSPEDVRRYGALRDEGLIPGGRRNSVLFVLGRYADAQGGEPRDLPGFLDAWDGETPWAVCAFGPREHACCVAAAAFGGHVRVGFENNLLLRDGRTAPDNAALVRQMREAATALGRPLATADEVRALFWQPV